MGALGFVALPECLYSLSLFFSNYFPCMYILHVCVFVLEGKKSTFCSTKRLLLYFLLPVFQERAAKSPPGRSHRQAGTQCSEPPRQPGAVLPAEATALHTSVLDGA